MIVLCADDFALTEGISRAVGELAAARRLSATSVMVTTPHWQAMAPRLRIHRGHLAIGLHLNLTLGSPLGTMPRLAPNNTFPRRNALMTRALLGLLDPAEITGEIARQLDAFEKGLGSPPDHIDGHEHVHVLSGIRQPLLEAVSRRYSGQPLIRDPLDRLRAIIARSNADMKIYAISALAFGFGSAARRMGLPTNEGFSGFSRFDVTKPFAEELGQFFIQTGPRHIIMCHPGHRDPGNEDGDAIAPRRPMEYDALMRDVTLPGRIWRPSRAADGPPVDWSRV